MSDTKPNFNNKNAAVFAVMLVVVSLLKKSILTRFFRFSRPS